MKPANDNTPRTLADQLAAVLAYRNRPDAPPEPMQSNFRTEPSTVLVEPEVRMTLFTEQNLRVTPSIVEISREMRHPPVRNADGQITSIGRLRFSDGKQTEKAHARGPDGDVIQYDRRMPAGAMLGTSERLTDSAGGGNAPAKVIVSNAALADALGVEHRPYIPGRTPRRGKSYKQAESRALLDEAIANTPVLPPVMICPPGLANGTQQASECFIGMKIGSTGKGGLIQWVDLYTAGREHDEWVAAEGSLSEKDKSALKAAMTATSFEHLGMSLGQSREYARRKGGKAALVAANDNYLAAKQRRAS